MNTVNTFTNILKFLLYKIKKRKYSYSHQYESQKFKNINERKILKSIYCNTSENYKSEITEQKKIARHVKNKQSHIIYKKVLIIFFYKILF